VVYVESSTTGRFFRVNLGSDDPLHRQLEGAIEVRYNGGPQRLLLPQLLTLPIPCDCASSSSYQGRKRLLDGSQSGFKGKKDPYSSSPHEETLQEWEWWWGFLLLILEGILAGSTCWITITAGFTMFGTG